MKHQFLVVSLFLGVLASERSSMIAAADEPALEKVQTLALEGPAGGLDHLALDVKRARLFVANTVNGSLDVVDLKAGRLLKQIPGQGRIRGIAYSPTDDRIFVGNGAGGVCNLFDGGDFALLRSVSLGDDADNVRFNPKTGRIYVVHSDQELSIISAKDGSIRSPIPVPGPIGGFQLESSRPRMYVNSKVGQVVVINLDTDHIVDRFPVAPATDNSALAIDEPNHRLFVGCRREPSLVVIDSDTGKVVARLSIPGDVDDVSYDANRERILASCGAGAIAVIQRVDADHYESIATIRTTPGARTSTYDPNAGRLYVAVPRREDGPNRDRPEVWVYQARP